MARAVTQRKQIPYLLIIFVFLFLVATVLAIVWRMDADEEKARAAAFQQQLDELATNGQLDESDVVARRDAFRSPETGQEAVRVIPGLQRDLETLAEVITGERTTVDDAVARAAEARTLVASDVKLIPTIRQLHEQREALQEKVASLTTQLNQEQLAAATAKNELQQQLDAKDAEIGGLEAQITQLVQQAQLAETENNDSIIELRDGFETTRKALDAKIAVLNQQLTSSQALVKRLETQIQIMEIRIADLVNRKIDQGVVVSSDGLVIDVAETDDEVVYINIGSENNVIAGLTFSIYPASGITGDGEKGRLVVTRVHETTSECRVTLLKSERDPITPDDLIVNIAFDQQRPYAFVVQGNFDLHGSGSASAEGADEVRSLIRRFRGSVTDSVGVGTDFLVMGEEPEQPVTPDDNDEPAVWRVYEEQMRLWQAYQTVKTDAETLSIPILNTNRFLALTGYFPAETLRYQSEVQ